MTALGGGQEARGQEVLLNLLNDLQAAKTRIEQQAAALQDANEKLRAASRLKDEFVAKVSHELRTPLTSIKEGVSLILDGALGPTTAEQRDFLKTMDGDIDRLTELINNVLDIAKIEAGRMRLAREQLDLKALLDSMIRSYQPIIGHRRVETVWEDDLPPVFADPHRIRQVFTNLFSNALKFTSDRGVILFRGRRHDGMVAVGVEDDGPGISPRDVPKLFQKFSQVRQESMRQVKGTGLGLTVCKELTELHHGGIDVVSTLGRGTIFTVRLPVYTDALALQESLREMAQADGEERRLVGMLAVDVGAGSLTTAVERVRACLHRDDVVASRPPSWIIVLAATGTNGLWAMAQRLRATLPDGARLRLGAALFAGDEPDAEALFQQATSPAGMALLAAAPAS